MRTTQKRTSKGRKIVAEYDPLSKKVTQLYSMQEIVLPEDKLKVFNKPLEVRWRTEPTQLKKWLLQWNWKLVIDHSMERLK